LTSEPDNENPHPAPIRPYVEPKAYDTLYDIRHFIASWNKEWGPVACWPPIICKLHEDAFRTNTEGEWKYDMEQKSFEGLWALGEIRKLFIELPRDPWQVRDLWCQAFDLASEIQAGVACLRAHISMYTT
jgi:hypothetical protein